jgi:hypothetical protein
MYLRSWLSTLYDVFVWDVWNVSAYDVVAKNGGLIALIPRLGLSYFDIQVGVRYA